MTDLETKIHFQVLRLFPRNNGVGFRGKAIRHLAPSLTSRLQWAILTLAAVVIW